MKFEITVIDLDETHPVRSWASACELESAITQAMEDWNIADSQGQRYVKVTPYSHDDTGYSGRRCGY